MSAALLLASAVCAAAPTGIVRPDSAGPFVVARLTVSIPRGRGAMKGILYYPLPGDSPPVPRPVVVFGHGYLAAASRYDSICRRLTSHGFCVLVPASPDPFLFYSLAPAADDMRDAVGFIDSLARVSGVHIDQHRIALAGHSMGGGAAFLDAQRDRTGSVKAVVGLAPYRISARIQPESMRVPALVIAGANDRSTPAAAVRRDFFSPCLPPAYYVLVRAGGHNGFLDLTSFVEDGFEPFDRVVQLKAVRTLMTAFLEVYLAGDERYLPWLLDQSLSAGLGAQVESK